MRANCISLYEGLAAFYGLNVKSNIDEPPQPGFVLLDAKDSLVRSTCYELPPTKEGLSSRLYTLAWPATSPRKSVIRIGQYNSRGSGHLTRMVLRDGVLIRQEGGRLMPDELSRTVLRMIGGAVLFQAQDMTLLRHAAEDEAGDYSHQFARRKVGRVNEAFLHRYIATIN